MTYRPNYPILAGFVCAYITTAIIGTPNNVYYVGLFAGVLAAGFQKKGQS